MHAAHAKRDADSGGNRHAVSRIHSVLVSTAARIVGYLIYVHREHLVVSDVEIKSEETLARPNRALSEFGRRRGGVEAPVGPAQSVYVAVGCETLSALHQSELDELPSPVGDGERALGCLRDR